uniref:carnosine N-methyltransferase-like n=1 Tax=Styela clava TaxID=7725 RepID=UPI001939DB16|nr:carnosine N-methyltransferase-like [Styela clava]
MTDSVEQNGSIMEEDIEEAIHFTRVLNSFRSYKKDALAHVLTMEKNFLQLPEAHRKLLPNHLNILSGIKTCVEQNSAICMEIVKSCGNAFQNKSYEETENDKTTTNPRPMDLDKVRTTLKQIMRDWSEQGQVERDQCYKPIIDEINQRLPLNKDSGLNPTVLVPGCGLGRLAWELARMGYICEGNEFSFFMLFTSNFILNRTPHSSADNFHQFTIHPWVTQKCNVSTWDSVLASVRFPDVNPALLPPSSRFSMAAGDFLDCYKKQNTWNCVATCYFIDTAHNVISYIERIFHILVPGGVWVNLGPLLYHYADMPHESSVEFSYEQIIRIVKNVGFEVVKDQRNLDSTYVNNPTSMLQYSYKCCLLVAIKPLSNS